MNFFTSDHHFGHANIIGFVHRPFKNVEEMDSDMTERWNEVVSPEDTVWHLGDFTLGSIASFQKYIYQLNGTFFIVPGGHDWRWLKEYDPEWQGINVTDPLITLDELLPKKDGHPQPIVLCHYPLLSWDRSHYGTPHLHGHVHNTIGSTIGKSGDLLLPPNMAPGTRIDVGVDGHDFYPYSLTEIQEMIANGGTK